MNDQRQAIPSIGLFGSFDNPFGEALHQLKKRKIDWTLPRASDDQVRGTKLKYKSLTTCDTKLLTQIKSLYVFTQNGSDIIFITNSDDVYGLGTNKSGLLGLGHIGPVTTPQPIPELCGKSVKKIVSKATIMVALTKNRHPFPEVYIWGEAEHDLGRVGNQHRVSQTTPLKIDVNESIVDVDVTHRTTYLFNQTGSVFWFMNSHFKACQISMLFGLISHEITSICCGYNHILALTVEGKVYSWGINTVGQLGLGHNLVSEEPKLIELKANVFIKQIVCGSNHSLLLSTDEEIYSFGSNTVGQLGIGCYDKPQNKPKLIIKEAKFEQIFAINETSIGLSKNCVYIWGKTKDSKFDWPTVTTCTSIQDTIDSYLSQPFTYKPLSYRELFEGKPVNRLQKTMSKLFNNSLNSDLKFKFKHRNGAKDQFEYIYGHKWFIAANSQHFETMFSKEWSESVTNEVLITDCSYDAYYQYIRCLYTETINSENIKVLMQLLDITNRYLDEDVKYLCAQRLKPLIELGNVCSLYSCAVRYRSADLEDFCFEFIVKNMVEIMNGKDYEQMNSAFAKQLFTNYAKYSEQMKN